MKMNTNGSHSDGLLQMNLNNTPVTQGSANLFDKIMHSQKDELLLYRTLACSIGALLIVSNLIVVVSSGLILRKAGSRCKSTILLLGNVSLADTLIGLNVIIANIGSHNVHTNSMCIFLIGLIVTPTLVSVISVGLIAVDRYIYILHGLYYRRWMNTTRVRISIMFTWLLGIALGFMPATGWAEDSMGGRKCWYLAVAPPGLITLIALIGFLPVSLVWVLYSIVLYRALKTVEQLQTTGNDKNKHAELRMNRAKVDNRENSKRISSISASIETGVESKPGNNVLEDSKRISASIETGVESKPGNNVLEDSKRISASIETGVQSKPGNNVLEDSTRVSASIETGVQSKPGNNVLEDSKRLGKNMEPCKWRAIKVVFLTTGSLMCTWLPYFIATIMYVLCDEKSEEERCLTIEQALTRPLANLALLNSLFNPLIYAWWHKGFNAAVRKIFAEFRATFLRYVKSSKSCLNS